MIELLNELLNYEEHQYIVDDIHNLLRIKNCEIKNKIPLEVVDKFQNLSHAEPKLSIPHDLIIKYCLTPMHTIHFKNAIIKEIGKFNDEKIESNFDDYNKTLESIGFLEILALEKDEYKESFFMHKEHTILVISRSSLYDPNKLDSARLYFNAKSREGSSQDKIDFLKLSKHYQLGTDIICGSCSLLEYPQSKVNTVIEQFEILNNFIDCDVHSKLINLNDSLSLLSKEHADKLFLYSVRESKRLNKSSTLCFNLSFYSSVLDFYNNLSVLNKNYIYCYGTLIDGRYSSNDYLPKHIKEMILEDGRFDSSMMDYITSQIIFFQLEEHYLNYFDFPESTKSLLHDNDLLLLREYFNSKGKSYFEDLELSQEFLDVFKL